MFAVGAVLVSTGSSRVSVRAALCESRESGEPPLIHVDHTFTGTIDSHTGAAAVEIHFCPGAIKEG